MAQLRPSRLRRRSYRPLRQVAASDWTQVNLVSLNEHEGKLFGLLIAPPLNPDQINELTVIARAKYLIARIKTCNYRVLYHAPTNSLLYSPEECMRIICEEASEEQVARWVYELLWKKWLAIQPSGTVTTGRSDSVTSLLVALLIYNEGGRVQSNGNVYQKSR